MKPSIRIVPAGLVATMMALNTVTVARAQSLQAHIVLRPLTAVDRTTYGLPSSTDYSGGLSTVGIGTAVYLEVEVNTNFPALDITNVTWSLIAEPAGSMAVLTNSPLGINVPIYEPSDRLAYQVAGQLTGKTFGRALLRPDIAGSAMQAESYTVEATISTTTGTTNVTQTIIAGTYMGVETCELCHSGGQIAEDKWTNWVQTLHAQIFSGEIDGLIVGPLGDSVQTTMSQSCLQCHTTGYDANTNAIDGGFYNLETETNWTIPTVLTNGNWASMQAHYPALAGLANVQCESCHGPGSQHAYSLGNTNLISVNYTSGDCNQCHDDATHHAYGTEWLNSAHAVTTTIPATEAEANPAQDTVCVGCHTAIGFIDRINGVTNNIDLSYMPINCQACHEPHGDTIPANNPHMIRTLASVTLQDGTVVTNAGEGLLCMECHQARQKAATYATTYHSNFGPHHGPQADMLEGVNGYTYGEIIPSSAHANAVSNTCVACHMQSLATSDPALTYAGGHTFEMAWNNDDLVAACQQCHGPAITEFNFPLQDYDGDGVIEGVQTEVLNLLNQLLLLLPSGTPTTNWTVQQLEADYNYQFVQNDGSYGIHNTAYAVGLLKASIANLTGKAYTGPLSTNDLAFYEWQLQWFGSASASGAGYNAVNNSSGVPNWLMFDLGLNPFASFESTTNGVIYFNGSNIVNGATNTIAIYTAAEIVFNTQHNVTYQIQGISALSGTWQDISTNIPGTGGSISYLTPTRNHPQMFFRVVHTP